MIDTVLFAMVELQEITERSRDNDMEQPQSRFSVLLKRIRFVVTQILTSRILMGSGVLIGILVGVSGYVRRRTGWTRWKQLAYIFALLVNVGILAGLAKGLSYFGLSL